MAPGTTVTTWKRSSARRSKFWLVMYSRACQRVHRLTRLPTLALPATAPIVRILKVGNELGDGVGGDHGVGVDADIDLFVHAVERVVERGGLASVGLGEHLHAAGGDLGGVGLARHLEGAVLEPSSITMTWRFS